MTDRLRLVVSGASGRMGGTVARLAKEGPGIELVGGIDRAGVEVPEFPEVATPENARDLLERADVVVDFSAPEQLRRLLESQRDVLSGRALVIGTTGLEREEEVALDGLAAEAAVLVAANFSVGVNLLLALAERTARVLGPDYDIEITEAHHRRKVDAPSGTALALGEAVARGREVELDSVRRDGRSGRPGERPRGEVGFHALRGGDIVGEHHVLYIGERERVELAHVATDRALFAEGSLRAARWMAGRSPGRYTMNDVLGLA